MTERGHHKFRSKLLTLGILIVLGILVNVVYDDVPDFRHWYEGSGDPALSGLQRILTGWCPFSLGDILYLAAGVGVLLFIVDLVRTLWRHQGAKLARLFLDAFSAMVSVYIIFLLCWGLNYRSLRVEKEFSIHPGPYTTAELVQLSQWLVNNTNRYHLALDGNRTDTTVLDMDIAQVFAGARLCYERASVRDPALAYHHRSLKPSMYGYLMNYLGVSGYYDPFTGEAQVNTTIPTLLQPFVCCHEMAHQIGFAPEEWANFTGFVVAMQSPEPAFRYSANFDLTLYALGELRFRDSAAEKTLWAELDTGVKRDYRTIDEFYRGFANPVDPLMSRMYDRYLRANHEAEGIHSYDEVIALLVPYYRKLKP